VQRRRKLIDVVIWILAASTAGLFVLFVLVLTGVVVDDDTGSGPPAGTVPTTTAPGTVTIRPEPPPTETTAAEPAPPELARVTVTATRGACWVQAKVGSENGRTLAERVLLEGESVTMRAAAVWLTLGASANVDVTVNGRPRRLGFGTVAVVLTARSQT
jgi:hypothetical protein